MKKNFDSSVAEPRIGDYQTITVTVSVPNLHYTCCKTTIKELSSITGGLEKLHGNLTNRLFEDRLYGNSPQLIRKRASKA